MAKSRRLRRFLAAIRLMVYREENPHLDGLTAAARWTLELARNTMVVGAVLAIANRSGNIWIKVFAGIANLALVWFAIVPLYRYRMRAIGSGWGLVLSITATVVIGMLIYFISIAFGTFFRILFEAIGQGVKP